MIKRSRIIVYTNPLSISNPTQYIIASSENHPNLLYSTMFKAHCSSTYITDNLSYLEKNDFHCPGVTSCFHDLRHNHWKQIIIAQSMFPSRRAFVKHTFTRMTISITPLEFRPVVYDQRCLCSPRLGGHHAGQRSVDDPHLDIYLGGIVEVTEPKTCEAR